MDSKIDKVRKALEIADAFCGRHTADECPDTIAIPIKDALAALSAIDPEAIRREMLLRDALDRMYTMVSEPDFPTVPNKYYHHVLNANRVLSAEPAQDGGKSDGVELIRRERERQKTVEGWTPEHDDQHARGELASAAVCYAMIPDPESAVGVEVPADWPESWSESWWKPSPNNRVRELSKAGALIAAEIDRLMRAAEVKRRTEEARE